MRKSYLSLVLILCLLLTGCGGSREMKSAYDDFSAELSRAECLSFKVKLRAEYEHKTALFGLSYTEDAEGAVVTVESPSLISGISARVEKGGTKLEFGDISLDTGDLNEHGLSPMSSLPMLVKALKEGCPDSFWTEDGKRVVQLIPDDNIICTVWFSSDMTPLRAEIISDGRVTVYAEISDWATS